MITLTLSTQELQNLITLLDAGIKATGWASIKIAASVLPPLEAAVAEANAKAAEPTEQKEAA